MAKAAKRIGQVALLLLALIYIVELLKLTLWLIVSFLMGQCGLGIVLSSSFTRFAGLYMVQPYLLYIPNMQVCMSLQFLARIANRPRALVRVANRTDGKYATTRGATAPRPTSSCPMKTCTFAAQTACTSMPGAPAAACSEGRRGSARARPGSSSKQCTWRSARPSCTSTATPAVSEILLKGCAP